MKTLLYISASIILLLTIASAVTSCDVPTANDVTIERINADKEIDIAKEETKQAEELTKQKELELKILKEKKQ
jgi:uncharacterized protein YqfA (UPF0365 family)